MNKTGFGYLRLPEKNGKPRDGASRFIGATDWDRTKAPGFWGWFFGGFSLISFIVFLLCIIFCIIKTSGELAWILDEVKQTGY